MENMDWSLCFLCQNEKKDKCRTSSKGQETLSKQLLKFYNIGELGSTLTELCKDLDAKSLEMYYRTMEQNTINPATISITTKDWVKLRTEQINEN